MSHSRNYQSHGGTVHDCWYDRNSFIFVCLFFWLMMLKDWNWIMKGSSQVVAIRVTAERCAFYNCRFLGWQVDADVEDKELRFIYMHRVNFEKFRTHLLKKLMKKEVCGDSLDDVVGIYNQYTSVKSLGSKVLVKIKVVEGKTDGGIVLPTYVQTKPQGGKVVAVGI